MRLDILHEIGGIDFLLVLHRIVTHGVGVESLRDFLFDSVECSSANEENVVRVDLNVVLIGVFAPTLGGHVDDGAFEQLEHALLYAFTTDISRDRGVVSLACYLVYLVNEDNTSLGSRHIVVGNLEQTTENALHIFTDITGLCEDGGVDDGERYLQQFGNGARQEGFARTGRADHDNIALFNLHIVVGRLVLLTEQALVVIVDRHRQVFLCIVLSNNVLVEVGFDVFWLGKLAEIGFHALCSCGAQTRVHDFFGSFGAVTADAGICAVYEHVDL